MQSQIKNTILALRTNFDPEFKSPDRLDRELRTIELQSLLLFYSRRAARYKYLNEETAKEYEEFILSLQNGDYIIRFKKMGFIYEFQSDTYQRKDVLNDTIFYILGKPMIEMIIEDVDSLRTVDVVRAAADEDMKTEFETSDRILRENSFHINNDVEDIADIQVKQRVKMLSSSEIEHVESEAEKDNNNTEINSIPNGESNSSDSWHTTGVIETVEIKPDQPLPPVETKPKDNMPPDTAILNKPKNYVDPVVFAPNYIQPTYDILIGKTSGSEQYGILGESINGHRKIAIDLSETNTISLFGVQGGGKELHNWDHFRDDIEAVL